MSESDWQPLDDQTVFGLAIDLPIPDTGVRFEAAIQFHDDSTNILIASVPVPVRATFIDAMIGVAVRMAVLYLLLGPATKEEPRTIKE